MESLSFAQFQIVSNLISFTLASMLAAFVFFILARSEVGEKYH